MSVPTVPVAREALTAKLSNALSSDIVEVVTSAGIVVDTYGASSAVEFLAPVAGVYTAFAYLVRVL